MSDYEETWNYSDVTVGRKESGLPVKVGTAGLEGVANYNYLRPCGDMFNLRLGVDSQMFPILDKMTVMQFLKLRNQSCP